jgi:ribonuclease VapC
MLLAEQDATRYANVLAETMVRGVEGLLMSTVSLFETAMLIDRKGDAVAREAFAQFEQMSHLRLVPFDSEQIPIAREAWRRFGKGSGHPAQLNFGDCITYALAKHRGQSLLFKGEDFSHTDIEPALKD